MPPNDPVYNIHVLKHLQYNSLPKQQQQPMEAGRTITIEPELWDKTQEELYRLRQENLQLHARVRQLEAELKGTTFKARLSMTQGHLESGPIQISPHKSQKARFKADMTQWLANLNKKQLKTKQKEIQFCIQKTLSGILQQADEFHDPPSHEEEKKQQESPPEQAPKKQQNQTVMKQQEMKQKIEAPRRIKKQMRLIESICLYGPCQKQIRENMASRRMMLKNSLLYSVDKEQEETFKIYGEYFYPESLVAAKVLRQEQAPTQVNQIIFRKNTKKQDCSMFLFRGDDNNQQLKLQNPILSRVNTGKWLCAFFVQFSDFESLKIEESLEMGEDKNNKSVCENTGDDRVPRDNSGRESDRVCPNKSYTTHYVKGKYTLCIFTYFPFINVIESLLSCILDQVKIRRVEKFSNTNQMSDVSIKFFIGELAKLGAEIQGEIERLPCDYGDQKRIKVGNVEILFDMSQSKFDSLIFSGWAHDILKIFQKDLIFDIFTNMMTEQSICFVCDNMHLLTYVIFFFVCVLTFPFAYPHPCISSVTNYELLESPFVVVAGINQSSKWLDEHVGNYPKKIFVDLNDEAKIKGKKKPKIIKSDKLKKIFNSLYKKIEANNSPVPQIFKKKQTIIRPASKQQNSTAIAFLKSLQSYYHEQLFIFLPNPAIISHIRDKIEQKNETSKIFSILKEIEKYLKESRKHRERDQFIDMLIQQQIFYVFMGAKYQLD